MGRIRLALRLGLFQLSLGLLSVLTLGLLNRLLIQDLQLPAGLVALAIGAQELMGVTRAWFGSWSDRISVTSRRRTPFVVGSSFVLSLLFGLAVWVVLRLADVLQNGPQAAATGWIALLMVVFVGIGAAVSAGGTAFSALIIDLTGERDRPRLLSVVWSLRLAGVLVGTALVNRVFGSACAAGADRMDVLQGLERLLLVVPPLLFALGLLSVVGVERPRDPSPTTDPVEKQRPLRLMQTLNTLRGIPQASSFMAVLCLFTFSMFLNDAVLEPYGAAIFGMNICATTALNAFFALGFLVGLLSSGFQLVPRFGMVRTCQLGAVLASTALVLMLVAAPWQQLELLRVAVAGFGFSLGICIHGCLSLMFQFVQPGMNGVLLGVWGVGYAYSRGLATVSGGSLLTLLKTLNGGDGFAAYGGVFALQISCFLLAALLMNRLDVRRFQTRMQSSLAEVMALVGE